MKKNILLNIFVFKIIMQTNLNNKYLSRPNKFLVFGLCAFTISEGNIFRLSLILKSRIQMFYSFKTFKLVKLNQQ